MYETISILMNSVGHTTVEYSLCAEIPIERQDSGLSAVFEISLTLKTGGIKVNLIENAAPTLSGKQQGHMPSKSHAFTATLTQQG